MYRGRKHGKLDKGCVLDVMSRRNYKHCSLVDDFERFYVYANNNLETSFLDPMLEIYHN